MSMKRKEVVAKGGLKSNTLSYETKNFIQKICYRKSASIDMTTYGFMKDSKVRPINLMVKPLRNQLERIWGKAPIKNKREKSASRKGQQKMPPVKPRCTTTKNYNLVKNKNNAHILDLTTGRTPKKRQHPSGLAGP